jgi:lipoprotein-releasing system ATP-binding protein
VRNREVGFVFQSHHLLPQCTVLENVLVPTLPLADAALKESAPARARQLLEKVGLGHRLGHRPGQLSGGERQRVAVVRSLINRPKLLLADEPTGALDRSSAENLGDLLVRLNVDEGVSLIVVTHALDLAKRLQRVFELRDGTLHELVDAH